MGNSVAICLVLPVVAEPVCKLGGRSHSVQQPAGITLSVQPCSASYIPRVAQLGEARSGLRHVRQATACGRIRAVNLSELQK